MKFGDILILVGLIMMIESCSSYFDNKVSIETLEINNEKHQYMVFCDENLNRNEIHFSECKFCKKQK